MGAQIPRKLSESELSRRLAQAGLERIHQGKVRDTYSLPDRPDHLFLVASDRLSIFDFVLAGEVADKGAVLTALTVHWLTGVLTGVEHHLVAHGAAIDAELPASLRGWKDLQSRAMVVKKLNMLPVECVARGYLTGSGWGSYKKSGEVCGIRLPEDLHDGSRLPEPIFTPTTKAEDGHDLPMSAEEVERDFGTQLVESTLNVYTRISDYARERGVIFADTKFEFGEGFVLGDEVGTPDSSRFWDRGEWEKAVAEKRSPSGYDKQPVREWGKTVATPFESDGGAVTGIHKLDPEKPEHVAFVHEHAVPEEILQATTSRYRDVFQRLTGRTLEQFQKDIMKIG